MQAVLIARLIKDHRELFVSSPNSPGSGKKQQRKKLSSRSSCHVSPHSALPRKIPISFLLWPLMSYARYALF